MWKMLLRVTFAVLALNIGHAYAQTVPPVPTIAGIRGYNIPASALAPALAGTTGSTLAAGNDSRITGAAQTSNNLSDLGNKQAAFQNLMGLPPIYAANYGVRANGAQLSDLSTTAASTLLTSVSYSFVSSDIGKDITLYAGSAVTPTATITSGAFAVVVSSITGIAVYQSAIGAGIPAGSYVVGILPGTSTVLLSQAAAATSSGTSVSFAAVQNTTISAISGRSAVLATAAVSTETGTRGTFGTDDTAALQSAVNAAGSLPNGGRVMLPAGTSMITNGILWRSRVSMVGVDRNSSILKWASVAGMGGATNPAMLYNVGAPAPSPSNTLVDFTFRDFQIDMSSATVASATYLASCVVLQNTVRWRVEDTTMQGSPASCIRNDYAQDNIITGNYFALTGRLSNGVGTGGNSIGGTLLDSSNFPTASVVSNNVFYDPGVTAILYQGQQGVGVTNARSDLLVIEGNLIRYDAFDTNDTTNIAGIDAEGAFQADISGNVVNAPTYSPSASVGVVGIEDGYGDNSTCTASSNGTLITGNTVTGMGTSFSIISCGSSNLTVSDNVASYSGDSFCYKLGTSTTLQENDVILTGNVGHHCYKGGMLIDSLGAIVDGLTITGNTLYDNNTVGLTGYSTAGISFVSTGTGAPFNNVYMTGNNLYDDGAATQEHGIGVSSNTILNNANIQGNNIFGSLGAPIYFTDSTGLINGVVANNGPQPTFSVTGAGAPVGTATQGTFVASAAGSMTAVVTPNATAANILAPHGYYCSAQDITTPTDAVKFASTTQSTVTFTGTVAASDSIAFGCVPY